MDDVTRRVGVVGQPAERASTALMQIGAVARAAGVSIRTVRHYENVGLVAPAQRSPGGFRLYDAAVVDRLATIAMMKPLGFSLDEMRSLLDARARLGSAESLDVPTRRELEERIAMFAELTEVRLAALREQLSVAESFADLLLRPVDRPTRGIERP